MPPIFTDEELERMHMKYVPLPMADPRPSRGGERMAFSSEDPRKGGTGSAMAQVQPLEGAQPSRSCRGLLKYTARRRTRLKVTVKPTRMVRSRYDTV